MKYIHHWKGLWEETTISSVSPPLFQYYWILSIIAGMRCKVNNIYTVFAARPSSVTINLRGGGIIPSKAVKFYFATNYSITSVIGVLPPSQVALILNFLCNWNIIYFISYHDELPLQQRQGNNSRDDGNGTMWKIFYVTYSMKSLIMNYHNLYELKYLEVIVVKLQ